MEVLGTIKVLGTTAEFGAKAFKKRELVVTTDEQYPQDIMIEFVQDKCEMLDAYELGQNVKVGINLRGREWINGEGVAKYFNSLQGWRIEKLSDAPSNDLTSAEDVENAAADLPF